MSWILRSVETGKMLPMIKPFRYTQLDADADEKQTELDSSQAAKQNRSFAFLLGMMLGAFRSRVVMQIGLTSKQLDKARVIVEERRVTFPEGVYIELRLQHW